MYYYKSQPTLWAGVFLVLFFTQTLSFAQSQGADYPSFEPIKKGRIFTTEGYEVKASDISIENGKYNYIPSKSSTIHYSSH